MELSQRQDMKDGLYSSADQYQNEELDPRVKVELDRLNRATDEINKLESALEDANNCFRHDLSESSSSLQNLGRKLGSAVEKARPYFEAEHHAKKLHLDCQRTAVQYHRANAVHQAARSTISLAEERFSNPNHQTQRQFDPAWQEMLNHATRKVLEAEAGRSASEREHETRATAFTAAQQRVTQLGRQLKSSINKARPYFEQKELFDSQLTHMSQRVQQLQRAVSSAKLAYAHALRSLEQISEEIHEQRKFSALVREPGVGAEAAPMEEETVGAGTEVKANKDRDMYRVGSDAASRNVSAALASTSQDIDVISKTASILTASLFVGAPSDECLFSANPAGCDKSISYTDSAVDSAKESAAAGVTLNCEPGIVVCNAATYQTISTVTVGDKPPLDSCDATHSDDRAALHVSALSEDTSTSGVDCNVTTTSDATSAFEVTASSDVDITTSGTLSADAATTFTAATSDDVPTSIDCFITCTAATAQQEVAIFTSSPSSDGATTISSSDGATTSTAISSSDGATTSATISSSDGATTSTTISSSDGATAYTAIFSDCDTGSTAIFSDCDTGSTAIFSDCDTGSTAISFKSAAAHSAVTSSLTAAASVILAASSTTSLASNAAATTLQPL